GRGRHSRAPKKVRSSDVLQLLKRYRPQPLQIAFKFRVNALEFGLGPTDFPATDRQRARAFTTSHNAESSRNNTAPFESRNASTASPLSPAPIISISGS